MGRLIDADRLRTRVILYFDMIQPELDQETKQYLVNQIHGLIEDMPTVDAESIIRCKDCKYYRDSVGECEYVWEHQGVIVDVLEDDFCSRGERK